MGDLMIRALIVDDAPPGIQTLLTLLEAHPDLEIAATARSFDKALHLCQALSPSVIFLDVHFGGESGFDFLARLPEPWPHIVFVTADTAHAVRAFETNALDYLLKPVEPERLALTLDRIRANIRPTPLAPLPENRILLKSKGIIHWIPWTDILYVRSDGNYTHVHLDGEEPRMIHKPLKEWIETAPAGFVQTHRQHLVQIRRISSVQFPTNGPRRLHMADGTTVPVGRGYWAALRSALQLSEPD